MGLSKYKLAELQSKEPRQKPRRKIGFIQDDNQ